MENQFEVTRDGSPDPSFKRKVIIKKTKYVIELTRLIVLAYSKRYVVAPIKAQINEQKRRVKLSFFDWAYDTNLKAQYESGKRTQRILAAKRTYLV